MIDFNDLTISGRLTRDPILKPVGADNLVVEISIASSRRYGERDETMFIDCEAWGKLAEIITDMSSKGDLVVLKGRLKQDNWEKDGVKRSKLILVVNEFLHARSVNAGTQELVA